MLSATERAVPRWEDSVTTLAAAAASAILGAPPATCCADGLDMLGVDHLVESEERDDHLGTPAASAAIVVPNPPCPHDNIAEGHHLRLRPPSLRPDAGRERCEIRGVQTLAGTRHAWGG